MNNEKFTYSLGFAQFSIDFDIQKRRSIELTRQFDSHGPDFAFAVSEISLQIGTTRYLIISSNNPGNVIEELGDFSAKLLNPVSVSNLEKLIPQGGWCEWMRGYWDRLNNDCNTVSDEATYDLLISFSLMESREGHIAAYRYNGIPTIEVGTRPEEGSNLINVWSEYDSKMIANEVRVMQRSIKNDLLQLIELKGSSPLYF